MARAMLRILENSQICRSESRTKTRFRFFHCNWGSQGAHFVEGVWKLGVNGESLWRELMMTREFKRLRIEIQEVKKLTVGATEQCEMM